VRQSAAHRAFTLIEMLISLTIVGTIVTMVYGSYAATSRSVDVYTNRSACSERAQLALRIMARQIRCAYASPTEAAAFRAETSNLRGDLLSFTTTGASGLGLGQPMGISRVAYRYDGKARNLSIRSEPAVTFRDSSLDSGTWRPMLTGVTGVELAFYDGRNWQQRWDARADGRLPQAVKIALSVTEQSGREHHYATTVPIICRRTAQIQQSKKPGGRT